MKCPIIRFSIFIKWWITYSEVFLLFSIWFITLNLITHGDISQLTYDEIHKIFKNYSRNSSRKGKSIRNSIRQLDKSTTPTISRSKLGTMLEDMNNKILHSLALQMDIMQLKMKREEAEKAMTVFFPRCRKKHEKSECPLDTM